ncbi:response regulator [Hydrogenophaga crocea]|uniref:Response regulator n=1 Tax=Hydrogenophaga crocea TaxID=2716225 RepID=A0A6G8IFU3_9BURK|nr:response regulator [Hydrogenophaga crocea]QIM52013.1 response regulator [Hydrogenophaga crocea]
MKSHALPKVLCVDDEPALLRALRWQLSREFEVAVASDGAQALALLRGDRFDVILSDQRMPGMSGTEFLQQAKVLSPHSVRLLLTGYADFNAVVAAINEGDVFRFISKPWDTQKLLQAVQEAARLARMSRMGWSDFQATAPDTLAEHLPELLLVQADAALAALCQDACEGLARPLAADDAADALTLLAQRRVAVVLVQQVPLSGDTAALVRALRRRQQRPAVVVCSASQDALGLQHLINEGLIHRFVTLPTTRDSLRRAIEGALQRHRPVAVPLPEPEPDEAAGGPDSVPPAASARPGWREWLVRWRAPGRR